MGLYCTFEQVRLRLIGKIQFTTDAQTENKMSVELANVLINEGEAQLELDLSTRYLAPFQTESGGPYSELPMRPTRLTITTLAEIMGVMKILDTDFGRGSAINGAEYAKALQARYKTMTDQLLAFRDGYGSGWKYPPMPGLKLNYQNAQADDGFVGQVLVIGDLVEQGTYPNRRINDPSMSWWTAQNTWGWNGL